VAQIGLVAGAYITSCYNLLFCRHLLAMPISVPDVEQLRLQ